MAMASTDVFYYFGSSFFSHEIKFSNRPRIGCLTLSDGFVWMTPEEQEQWRKLREAVRIDLLRLEDAKIPFKHCKEAVDEVELGDFHFAEGVWIYRHTDYANFLSVSVKHFDDCAMVRKGDVEMGKRCNRAHHYLLAPFFKDNKGLLCEYKEYLKISTDEDEKKDIRDRINDLQQSRHHMKYGCHHCPGTTYSDATLFMENDWTVRLFHGLQDFLPTASCNYTAQMGNQFNSLQSKYTDNFGSTGYFLFRGAPDLIIRSSTSRSYTVIATRPSRGEDVNSEDESVEVAREPPNIDPNTQMPIKMGELIAQLHFLMVSKALRRIKKQRVVGTVSCRGLLVDKQTGGKIVTASISCKPYEQQETMDIKVEYSAGGSLREHELCWYLNRLLQSDPTQPPLSSDGSNLTTPPLSSSGQERDSSNPPPPKKPKS